MRERTPSNDYRHNPDAGIEQDGVASTRVRMSLLLGRSASGRSHAEASAVRCVRTAFACVRARAHDKFFQSHAPLQPSGSARPQRGEGVFAVRCDRASKNSASARALIASRSAEGAPRAALSLSLVSSPWRTWTWTRRRHARVTERRTGAGQRRRLALRALPRRRSLLGRCVPFGAAFAFWPLRGCALTLLTSATGCGI